MQRLCPICGFSGKKFLYLQNFHNKVLSLMEKYTVVSCKKCGFVFADNIPSQRKFSRYYAIMSKYEYNYKDGAVSKDQLNYFSKVAGYLSIYLKCKTVAILDVGCSTGGLLSVLKKKGYSNLTGLDPSSYCVNAVKKLHRINAIKGDIDSFKTQNKYDLVILSATLEHLVDFEGSMMKIWYLLKDGGLLFIEVPDAERFSSFVSAPFQQFSIEHINYFSRYSMENMLNKYSFKKVDISRNINKINLTVDPDIFVLAEKINMKSGEIKKDRVSGKKIKSYIDKCSSTDKTLKAKLKKVFSENKKIIIWGTGTGTLRLIEEGLDVSKIAFFVDSNARYKGKKLNGLIIKSPEEIKENRSPILISSYAYQNEIASQIRNVLKLKNKIIKVY